MILNSITRLNRMNNIAQGGIPTDAVDMIIDFIDTIWTSLVEVLILAFLEMIWTLFLEIFIDLAPIWGLSLVIFAWCYFFYMKFVTPTR